MKKPFSLTLYCGASTECDPKFLQVAKDFGQFVGENKWSLYFGAGGQGLMGEAARACLWAGGLVHGIGFENEFLSKTEPPITNLTTLSIEKSIHRRKEKLHASGDVLVVLPGGLGTLDEVLEALTWQYLGIHATPIALVNAYGFWAPLETLLDKLKKERFLKDPERVHYRFFPSLDAVKPFIKSCALTA
tara:strand:+ start:229 stop:795 length:567 start_codon:yes stop_codon:yes gene_type:complete